MPIYAFDFDGTLVEDQFPEIGDPTNMIEIAKALKELGHSIILNTCRVDSDTRKYLQEAVEFCKSCGLEFDAVNENLPSKIIKYGGDTRKISADYYIDDRCLYFEANEDINLHLHQVSVTPNDGYDKVAAKVLNCE